MPILIFSSLWHKTHSLNCWKQSNVNKRHRDFEESWLTLLHRSKSEKIKHKSIPVNVWQIHERKSENWYLVWLLAKKAQNWFWMLSNLFFKAIVKKGYFQNGNWWANLLRLVRVDWFCSFWPDLSVKAVKNIFKGLGYDLLKFF